jgi:SAM-dependent methyltransferase
MSSECDITDDTTDFHIRSLAGSLCPLKTDSRQLKSALRAEAPSFIFLAPPLAIGELSKGRAAKRVVEGIQTTGQTDVTAPNPLAALSDPVLRKFIRDLLIKQYSRYPDFFQDKDIEVLVDNILNEIERFEGDSTSAARYLNEYVFDFANPQGRFRQAEKEHYERYFRKATRLEAEYVDQFYLGPKILDVGCGYNRFLKELADRHPKRHIERVGTDVTDYHEDDSRIRFIHQETHRLAVDEIGRGTVTSARIASVIHHIYPEYFSPHDPDAIEKIHLFLNDLYDVMASGGQVVIYEDSYPDNDGITFGCPFETMDEELTSHFLDLTDEQKYQWIVWNDWYWNIYFSGLYEMPMAYRYYTMGEWKRFFHEVGFEVVEAQYWGVRPSVLHGVSSAFFVIHKPAATPVPVETVASEAKL